MAAEAAISTLVELLADLLIKKVKFLQGVEGKVELLKDELKRMQSFLKDANKKQFEDESVRNWISEIREVAQDAQDTIEIFLLNVENAKNWGLLKRCTSSPKRMYHLDKIGDEIESILTRLDAIDRSRERYGIKDLGEAAESTSRWQVELRRRLCPWQKDEHLVGVEDDVKKLLQESILCEEKKGLSIAVLEGMGGIRKSTLAREIYNHPDVIAGPFDHRGWVVVSSEFTPQETIKQLILELPGSDKQKVRELEESTENKLYLLQKLQEMLHKQLEGKSYFIVLDDVWEKEHLESLITAFPDQQALPISDSQLFHLPRVVCLHRWAEPHSLESRSSHELCPHSDVFSTSGRLCLCSIRGKSRISLVFCYSVSRIFLLLTCNGSLHCSTMSPMSRSSVLCRRRSSCWTNSSASPSPLSTLPLYSLPGEDGDEVLDVYNNNFTGNLPLEFTSLKKLKVLAIGGNYFSDNKN